MADFLTPEELVAVLKGGKYKPFPGYFVGPRADGQKGFCCLGVYAEINHIGFDPDAAVFCCQDGPGGDFDPELPADHWLFTEVETHLTGESVVPNVHNHSGTIQSLLANANDRATSDSYELPIKVLEGFIAGCRKFQLGVDWVKPVFPTGEDAPVFDAE